MNSKNQGVAWNDSFSLGNEQVDLQHKNLFELVNGLINACLDGSDMERLQETLNFLVNYAVRHFHFEEELQQLYHYPDYGRHKKLHDDFKQTIGELVERYNQNGSSAELNSDVNKIVVRWLINHIQREDKKIGEHMQNTSDQ